MQIMLCYVGHETQHMLAYMFWLNTNEKLARKFFKPMINVVYFSRRVLKETHSRLSPVRSYDPNCSEIAQHKLPQLQYHHVGNSAMDVDECGHLHHVQEAHQQQTQEGQPAHHQPQGRQPQQHHGGQARGRLHHHQGQQDQQRDNPPQHQREVGGSTTHHQVYLVNYVLLYPVIIFTTPDVSSNLPYHVYSVPVWMYIMTPGVAISMCQLYVHPIQWMTTHNQTKPVPTTSGQTADAVYYRWPAQLCQQTNTIRHLVKMNNFMYNIIYHVSDFVWYLVSCPVICLEK